MKCYIYRCSKQADLYLYLAELDDFARLPEAILNGLGSTRFTMELDLETGSKLARQDASKVMDNLLEHGFHIQLPDKKPVDELMARIARNKD